MTSESHVEIAIGERRLIELGRQGPFVLASALTALAKDGQAAATASLPARFDRPTAFTGRAVGIVPAAKALPQAQVFVKREQAEYLAIQESGGERRPRPGAPVLLPVNLRLDPHGNIGRGRLRRERTRKDTFVSGQDEARTRHLPPGIYRRGKVGTRRRRSGGGRGSKGRLFAGLGGVASGGAGIKGVATSLRLLVRLHPRAAYRRRFGFRQTVAAAVRANARRRLAEAVARALATARK